MVKLLMEQRKQTSLRTEIVISDSEARKLLADYNNSKDKIAYILVDNYLYSIWYISYYNGGLLARYDDATSVNDIIDKYIKTL